MSVRRAVLVSVRQAASVFIHAAVHFCCAAGLFVVELRECSFVKLLLECSFVKLL